MLCRKTAQKPNRIFVISYNLSPPKPCFRFGGCFIFKLFIRVFKFHKTGTPNLFKPTNFIISEPYHSVAICFY